jgi:purine-binding chemotaxis protein CheW
MDQLRTACAPDAKWVGHFMGRHRLGNANPASGAAGSAYLFELRLDTLRLALPLDAVLRTTRVAEITPLPGAPSIVAGAINIAGEVLAAIDLRGRLALSARPLELDDAFVLVQSDDRVLAILASEVSGVAKYPASACVASARVTPGLQGLAGVVTCEDGLILIHDPERFFDLDEARMLDRALAEHAQT